MREAIDILSDVQCVITERAKTHGDARRTHETAKEWLIFWPEVYWQT
ncbi:hypothetical protein SuNHUV7_00060 (plasmid) [Pseudoseohaeicola sp. NH-UV-7]|nr:hypothetical protein [Sulfitobacter sp. JL08]